MVNSNGFNLNEAIDKWEGANFSQEDLTPSDKAEFKDHIFNIIDELLEKGLSEEEAFTVAKMRFGDKNEWGEGMRMLNEDNFQLKKIIFLFSGVILYILSYNFFLCVERGILLWSNYFNGNVESNVENVKLTYNIIYALLISGIVALFFLHKPIKWIFQRITLNLKWVILLVFLLIIFVVLERFLKPQIRKSVDSKYLEDIVFVSETYFKYISFIIVCLGYIVIYYRYENITNRI